MLSLFDSLSYSKTKTCRRIYLNNHTQIFVESPKIGYTGETVVLQLKKCLKCLKLKVPKVFEIWVEVATDSMKYRY
jgi:hypothetical protein